MTKRLLFVVNDAGFFVSHRLPIALAAKKNGYEVHIATPADAEYETLFAEQGFVFHSIPLARGKVGVFAELKLLHALYRLYKSAAPDIVHHVTIKPVLFGGIAARLAKVPAVVSAISGMGYVFIAQGIKAAIMRKLVVIGYKIALGHSHLKAVFQNQDDLGIFINNNILMKESIVLVKGSGVDIKQFSATILPTGKIKIILPARMLWDKGVGEFVEAAKILRAQGKDYEFILAGGVDVHNPAGIAEQQLKSWHNEGVVTWLGHQSDMAVLMKSSHIVCLPSYREGLPKALIEAAACARAIITTNVAGCRDVVDDGQTGVLVPVKNAQELAAVIGDLAANQGKLKTMGKAGRAKAEKEFAIEKIVKETLAVYRALESE